jgi:hypothetical protein
MAIRQVWLITPESPRFAITIIGNGSENQLGPLDGEFDEVAQVDYATVRRFLGMLLPRDTHIILTGGKGNECSGDEIDASRQAKTADSCAIYAPSRAVTAFWALLDRPQTKKPGRRFKENVTPSEPFTSSLVSAPSRISIDTRLDTGIGRDAGDSPKSPTNEDAIMAPTR